MIEPRASLAYPAGAHVPIRTKTVDRVTNAHRLAQAHVDAIHGAGERLVGGLDARVDDLDDLTVALLSGLVRARHLQGGGVVQGRVHGLGAQRTHLTLNNHQLVVTLDERGLDALGRLDGVQGRGRCLDREAVQHVRVVARR